MVGPLCPSHPFLCGLYPIWIAYAFALELSFFRRVPHIAQVILLNGPAQQSDVH